MEVANILDEYLKITFPIANKKFKLDGKETKVLSFDDVKKHLQDFFRQCN